jgi:hypothetical protein
MARRTLMARDAKMAKELATGLNTLEKRRAKTYHKKTYTVLVVSSCKFAGMVYGDRTYSFKKIQRKTER